MKATKSFPTRTRKNEGCKELHHLHAQAIIKVIKSISTRTRKKDGSEELIHIHGHAKIKATKSSHTHTHTDAITKAARCFSTYTYKCKNEGS